jgi:hypothetical protein
MASHPRRPSAIPREVIASAVVVAALWGCTSLSLNRRPGESGLATKRVVRKEPPTSLWAMDNTRCLVTAEKYRETALGTDVTCYWQSSDQSRSVIASDEKSPAATRGSDADVAGKTEDLRVRQVKGKKPKAPSAP